MKLTLADEQWTAILPAISNIDGGCTPCILHFLKTLGERFVLTKEMLSKVYTSWDSKLDEDEINDLLEKWVEV